MPDIPNRDELEQILARLLGKLNRRQLANLLEALGDPPNMANVPMSFWDEAGKELAQVVIPFSERVYLEAAERMAEIIPIGVDWGLVNEAASDWARHYGYDLISKINDSTRRTVSSVISNFFEQQWTLRDLTSRLGRIYGPVRGEMIAITEVTRAAVEGERALVSEIEKEGIRMVEVWQTRNDEIVCPICGSRHRKKRGDGWTANDGPPAHPRCRCWTNHEFEKPKEEGERPTEYDNLEQAIYGSGGATTADQRERLESLNQLSPEKKEVLLGAINDVRSNYDLNLDDVWVTEFMDDNVAADAPPRSIRINGNIDLDKKLSEANQLGITATGDFRGAMYHELAHNVNFDQSRLDIAYDYHRRLAGSVSRYALTEQEEWKAEIFALANSLTQDQNRVDYAKIVLAQITGR